MKQFVFLLMALSGATAGSAGSSGSQALRTCENIPYSQENCVRILACVGTQGLWFDGQAWGWNAGTVIGTLSSGVPCAGTWDADGPLGAGRSDLSCQDGLTGDVIYFRQDSLTGTVIGHGLDSKGRPIRVWTGRNVLQFLTDPDSGVPELPCGSAPVLLG